jgi:hypothetical protein
VDVGRRLKLIGLVIIAVLVVAIVTLRFTGLEPGYRARNAIARPGLWLKGEVVHTSVRDWSFVNDIRDPIRKNPFSQDAPSLIMVETRTPYFIPHSVTTGVMVRNGQLYIHSHQDRMNVQFPNDKLWTSNVARDPRVRLKIGGKLYEATVVLITNRDEAAALFGIDPATRKIGPDGKEHITAYFHVYRVFQRNVPEFGGGPALQQADDEK